MHTDLLIKRLNGSGKLNPWVVFLRFVTEAFLLFLAPAAIRMTIRNNVFRVKSEQVR